MEVNSFCFPVEMEPLFLTVQPGFNSRKLTHPKRGFYTICVT